MTEASAPSRGRSLRRGSDVRPHLAQCFELLPAQGAFVIAELSWLNAMSLHPVGPLFFDQTPQFLSFILLVVRHLRPGGAGARGRGPRCSFHICCTRLQRGLVCVGQRRGGAGADLAQVRDHAEVAPSSQKASTAVSKLVFTSTLRPSPKQDRKRIPVARTCRACSADQLALASRFRNPLWAQRLAAK